MVDLEAIASLTSESKDLQGKALETLFQYDPESEEEAQIIANLMLPCFSSDDVILKTRANEVYGKYKRTFNGIDYPKDLRDSSLALSRLKETRQNTDDRLLEKIRSNLDSLLSQLPSSIQKITESGSFLKKIWLWFLERLEARRKATAFRDELKVAGKLAGSDEFGNKFEIKDFFRFVSRYQKNSAIPLLVSVFIIFLPIFIFHRWLQCSEEVAILGKAMTLCQEKKREEAIQLLRPIAENGSLIAQLNLGFLCIEENSENLESCKWFSKAADQGSILGAQHAALFSRKNSPELEKFYERYKKLATADFRIWLEKAENGDVDALFFVASQFETNSEDNPNFSKIAAEFYNRCIDKGFVYAWVKVQKNSKLLLSQSERIKKFDFSKLNVNYNTVSRGSGSKLEKSEGHSSLPGKTIAEKVKFLQKMVDADNQRRREFFGGD